MLSNTALPTPAAALCPLCGQPNQCAMEAQRATGIKPAPCWCTQVTVSQDLLNRIPAPQRGLACVCAACVAASQA